MGILRISESEISTDLERARSVAGASFERGGLRYEWVATYSESMQAQAQERCQALQAGRRTALLVCHSNGNITVWQGPVDSFQVSVPENPVSVASSTNIPQKTEPYSENFSESLKTVTVKYRGRTIVKPVGSTDRGQQQEGQRSYRGRKY